jgi:hypothetical protein
MVDYPNRSDLRNPATRKVAFTGQTYGQATQQASSQQAVSPGSAPADVQAQQVTRPVPGAQSLTRPTERPNEPITAGVDIGAGPNAMQAGLRPRFIPVDDNLETLKALYRMYPSDGLLEVISAYTNGKM